jgi:hypothetical protein
MEKESFDLKVILPENQTGKLDAYFKKALPKN